MKGAALFTKVGLVPEEVAGRQPGSSSRVEQVVRAALQPPEDPTWRLEVADYRPELEHGIESRFTVANGLLGTRGALLTPTRASRSGTFVAGLFDLSSTPPAVPALLTTPDWLRLHLILDGRPLSLDSGELIFYRRTLDLRRGVLLTDWQQRDEGGHPIWLRAMHFNSLARRAIGVQLVQAVVAEPANALFEAWIEPEDDRLIEVRSTNHCTLWHTPHTNQRLALASAPVLHIGSALYRGTASPQHSHHRWHWTTEPGQAATFTRITAVARSDGDTYPPVDTTAQATLVVARALGVEGLLAEQVRAWSERWDASDVRIDGDEQAQRALRFALYHLIGAANPEDEYISIGARALTGEAYLGHVFWDTDIFLLPFYVFTWPAAARALVMYRYRTWPAAARALVMYRYRTLPAAREKARQLGYRGALYAWESALHGEESTPPYVLLPDGQVQPIRSGTDEQHISADVAYAVWQYWLATEDDAFLRDAGAEILVETARFWSSRATLEEDGRYHIRGVIGPDEYHDDIDDNAYTNGMAQWNLERGLEVLRWLQTYWPEQHDHLWECLALTPAEVAAWQQVRDGLVTGFDPSSLLFEQFAGFSTLDPVDLSAYAQRDAAMDVLLGLERTRHSQVIKQADVLMLLALLWERYPREVIAANVAYYAPRCAQDSSLSPAIHALVAARLGLLDQAERYFRQSAAIDLDDTMNNAGLGVHIATLGGLWQAAVLGFAGLRLREDGICLDPHLPPSWQTMRFPVQWHTRQLQVTLQQEPATVTVALARGAPLTIQIGALSQRVSTGQPWCCRWDEQARQWKEIPYEQVAAG